MSVDADLTDPKLRARAVRAALGQVPFDLLIEGGEVLDMVTGQRRRADVGLVGALIASVHAPDRAAQADRRLDASGGTLVPGLIDTQMHVERTMVTPATYAAHMVPRGVTTALWDPRGLANVSGVDGIDYALQAGQGAAMRVLTMAPATVPSAPDMERSAAVFTPQVLSALLARGDIHGVAGIKAVPPASRADDRLAEVLAEAQRTGKRLVGDSRDLTMDDLTAHAAAGVDASSVPTTVEDMFARLQAGLTVQLSGAMGDLLGACVEALNELGHLPPTVTLCTGAVLPDDLLAQGGLDHVLRDVIGLGLPVEWAYRAATLNAATRIGRPDLGLIAPGRRADIVMCDDLSQGHARQVLIDGRVVAREGQLAVLQHAPAPPATILQSVDLPPLAPYDFEVFCKTPTARIAPLSWPGAEVPEDRILTTRGGIVDLPDDMIRMAVANRYGGGTTVQVALLEHAGRWDGAFATTVSGDSHNLTVFGCDPQDMALAANALRDVHGGMVAVRNGRVQARVALPVGGLMSRQDLADVASDLGWLREALDGFVTWDPPDLTFATLFQATRARATGRWLSDMGLVDPADGRVTASCVLGPGPDA